MPRASQETLAINRILMANGLGRLGDSGVIPALARMVASHEHFRDLLGVCDPALRREMYSAMAPYLDFPAHPLDWYVTDLQRMAEVKQLPVMDKAGNLHPYTPPEAGEKKRTAEQQQVVELVETTIEELTAKGHLHLVCKRCTKEAWFPGQRIGDAIYKAREAGWTYDEVKGDGREICPDCMAVYGN